MPVYGEELRKEGNGGEERHKTSTVFHCSETLLLAHDLLYCSPKTVELVNGCQGHSIWALLAVECEAAKAPRTWESLTSYRRNRASILRGR